MDTVPDKIYFKDRDSRFIRVNKDLAENFGLADVAEALGKTDADFFTQEHAEQARYESLSDYRQLLDRIGQLRQEGLTIVQVAKQLNQEGYRTPRSRKDYTSASVRKLLSRQRHKAEQCTGPTRKKRANGG
jgi:hypothetical protein